MIREVRVGVRSMERFREVLPEDQIQEASRRAAQLRDRLSGRVLWNVNSTAVGGGVAEMLPPLLGYTRSIGIDSRWLVIDGNEKFFHITKRLHHALHGSAGDGSPLGEAERAVYEETLLDNTREMTPLIRRDDIVILHDPQTAGMAPMLMDAGAHVVWRCHIGLDHPDPNAELGWDFLRPYLADVSYFVFSRRAYVPEFCDHGKARIITPSIDAFSAKNQELSEAAVHTILVHTGLVEGPPPSDDADHGFVRADGSPGRVGRRADILRLGRAPSWETPLLVQVSRWDPLKDMKGVMEGFARLCDGKCPIQPELVLAGPNVTAVSDDPEGALVYEDVATAWRALPHAIRNRVHLVSLPVQDVEENAAIVNALQRHAAVVIQKSLQEGFGLTVTEAMWKGRPVVASAVGGIQDQIDDGQNGVLVKDATDIEAFADALCGLLCEPERMEAIGRAAKERVRERFLGVGHLLKYATLIEDIDGASESR
ncbi:MAG: glycosyltransferase [Myxococcales bacterium]|nr:glycosyltransferase [Myxococcales bacterium]